MSAKGKRPLGRRASKSFMGKPGLGRQVREAAMIRIETYQRQVMAYYNQRARPRTLKSRDMVFKKAFENTVEPNARI
ncbi:hypothetical protein CK203_103068 [Vitis vinifera]|uniref:Uncharacterized protein n=1 Tax=Vitis vinifera TaxID=29760 RepID=A0A438DV53_VITVI|nr:hypothetical protein CK203_103068 [Vitis vinifera]